jgi:hypothetical protein
MMSKVTPPSPYWLGAFRGGVPLQPHQIIIIIFIIVQYVHAVGDYGMDMCRC